MSTDSHRTPMMRQYDEAKRLCHAAILLFRMGDFYEMFGDDAVNVAPVLGLAVTTRDKGPNAMPMAGFPHHQLDTYIARLIAAGYRAAVCDQMENPATAKGLVRREVTRVVSAGTLTEDALLNPCESNYLAAIAADGEQKLAGLSWVELSTGMFYAMAVQLTELADHLARVSPAECLVPESFAAHITLNCMQTSRPDWAFGKATAREKLTQHFQLKTLEGWGFDDTEASHTALRAAGAILDYLSETQRQSLPQIVSLTPYRSGQQLDIDESSRRSLELTRTIRGGGREGSLLGVLDHCVTSMGSRLLADWIAAPLTNLESIAQRHDAVDELRKQEAVTARLVAELRRVADLERLMTRVVQRRASPRDLAAISKTLPTLPIIRDLLASSSTTSSALLITLRESITPCATLREKLAAALVDECPHTVRDGGVIRRGYDAELDASRDLARGGKEWIAAFQQTEIERTGITSLKVAFNRVFGYYIEITNTHRDKVPTSYVRRQTLRGAERYITPELQEYESKVLTAEEQALEREETLFRELVEATATHHTDLTATAAALRQLDVLTNFAIIARQRNYCRPQLITEPVIDIRDGRHPVLDTVMHAGEFVPNDIIADAESISLITGPNMAGKSTFIRQIALMTVMSQVGAFIPAASATIGVVDRIFARIGASDELARGQSTFMVEMTETARILHGATPQSLVILDEIGRGTSTYDGISLAWAIVEFLHNRIGCRTFFATHYHELTALDESLPRLVNLNVAVKEHAGNVVFLHRIARGSADKSYGIHVAQLAGIPRDVIDRARDILCDLETTHHTTHSSTHRAPDATFQHNTAHGSLQFSLFGTDEHPVLDAVRSANLKSLAAEEVTALVAHWQEMLAQSTTKSKAVR